MRVVILCIAMMVSASVWAQSASSKGAEFKLNPEYEAIIAEAKKQGKDKDPVDLALEKGKSEDWASLLDTYIINKVLQKDDAEIAEIKKEKEELLKRGLGNKKTLEDLKAEIFILNKKYIDLFISFEKHLDSKEIKALNEIYCGEIAISTEMKTAIEKHLIKYINTATCEATKLKLLTKEKAKIADYVKRNQDGLLSSYEIEEVYIIYHSPYTFPEIKAEIEQKLGKYLTPAKKQPKQ